MCSRQFVSAAPKVIGIDLTYLPCFSLEVIRVFQTFLNVDKIYSVVPISMMLWTENLFNRAISF